MNESKLKLKTRAIGPWPMNTYVLVCPQTSQSVLIDPGAEPDTLTAMLAASDPVAVLLTHTHPDHIGALDEMQARLRVPLLAHAGPHSGGLSINADRRLDSGDIVQIGDFSLTVISTPGHIDDQICFVLQDDNRVIVGDTIFEGGPGKTWSAAGFQTTLNTLRTIVLAWPDDTILYPGHGPKFRLGDQRTAIEAFLQKDHGDFFGDATWNM